MTLDILEQAPLGSLTRIVLRWPGTLVAPAPGQCLSMDDGSRLWPMRDVRAGQLEALSVGAMPPGSALCAIAGEPLDPPEGEILLLAEGLGLAPLIQLCERLRGHQQSLLTAYETGDMLPFRPRPSRFMVEGLPAGVIAAIPLLEDWAIPSRLASPAGLPGCFEGRLDEMLADLFALATVVAFGEPTFLDRIRSCRPEALTIET